MLQTIIGIALVESCRCLVSAERTQVDSVGFHYAFFFFLPSPFIYLPNYFVVFRFESNIRSQELVKLESTKPQSILERL